eukprot:gene16529-22753_t
MQKQTVAQVTLLQGPALNSRLRRTCSFNRFPLDKLHRQTLLGKQQRVGVASTDQSSVPRTSGFQAAANIYSQS